MNRSWVKPELRDSVVDFLEKWLPVTGLKLEKAAKLLGIALSKVYNWKKRYKQLNLHNGKIPRDFWLEQWEKDAIISFHHKNPLEGYRRLTYMMIDGDVVYVCPSSVYRVLSANGLLKKNSNHSKKGTGFIQPTRAHEHWHIDVSYLNIRGTFYYVFSVLDGYSRAILQWGIKLSMTEKEVEIILQKCKEHYPGEKPRIISDNGSQFISRDFKEFVRISEMTHVRTSPFYPQSNGKLERYHKTIKSECIRKEVPISEADANRIVERYVSHYNNVRLHSAIGYVAPFDKMNARDKQIIEERKKKLKGAHERRKSSIESQKILAQN